MESYDFPNLPGIINFTPIGTFVTLIIRREHMFTMKDQKRIHALMKWRQSGSIALNQSKLKPLGLMAF